MIRREIMDKIKDLKIKMYLLTAEYWEAEKRMKEIPEEIKKIKAELESLK